MMKIMKSRSEENRQTYDLTEHEEGGFYAEVYTAPFEIEGRPVAGSIYFLLDAGQISHFHEIDCDEIWYYHEGCGMRITVISDSGWKTVLLGADADKGERPMVVIPKGCIFAAENLESEGYTFVSCVTTLKFEYVGFRLVGRDEIKEKYPDIAGEIEHLAY